MNILAAFCPALLEEYQRPRFVFQVRIEPELRDDAISPPRWRRAMIHGSVVASFYVEDFSTERLKRLTQQEVQAHYRGVQQFTRSRR